MKSRFVICVALAAAACTDHEVKKLAAVRDEVCACKSVACAEAAMKNVPAKDVKSTHRSQRLAREMLDCLAELYAMDRPSFDPDEPARDEP